MNKIIALTKIGSMTLFLFGFLACDAVEEKVQNASERPNIVVVLVDDMGFSDLSCYGGEIETPNIDSLASKGLRFTQFYNTGRCCPTRASLMTGLNPHQVGIGHMTETPKIASPLKNHPYQGYLNRECVTLAEVLRGAGYHTLMAGKWHLGYHRDSCWPLQRGFDKYFGIISGACHYFNPGGDRGLTFMNDPVEPGEDFYVTDAFTDYAMDFVRQVREQDENPFFLYLAYNAPHWPLQAITADLKKYEGKYLEGWDVISARRLERQQQIGLIDPAWTPAPHEGPSWESLDSETQILLDLRMAAYAACIDSVDQNIGRLIAMFTDEGLLENTILFFLTDNGACQEGGDLGRGTEEEIRNPWDSPADVRCGRVWANVSSTPFRYYKHFVHEGGMATPLIVHWPSGISEENQGSFVRQYGYLPDFMPTLVELAGTVYPEEYQGNVIPLHVGTSLLPLIKGGSEPIHNSPTFWEHEGNRAIRDGNWKLVWAKNGPWELYDMEADRTEMNDLSKEMPEKFEELKAAWEEWATEKKVAFPESTNYYRIEREAIAKAEKSE